jgi:signal peptidase I
MTICGRCGVQNDDASLRCVECGDYLYQYRSRSDQPRKLRAVLGLVFAGTIAAGAFLPWVHVLQLFDARFADAPDGLLILAASLALTIASITALLGNTERWLRTVAIVAGLIVLCTLSFDFLSLRDRTEAAIKAVNQLADSLLPQFQGISTLSLIGSGLWLMGLGALGSLVLGLSTSFTRRTFLTTGGVVLSIGMLAIFGQATGIVEKVRVAASVLSSLKPGHKYRVFSMPNRSMDPTIGFGQQILVDESAYEMSSPQVGDIVVFVPPVTSSDLVTKRIIAVPGDSLLFEDGVLKRNGQTIDKVYPGEQPVDGPVIYHGVGEVDPDDGNVPPPDKWKSATAIPDSCYIVLGDNVNDSEDSRIWGCAQFTGTFFSGPRQGVRAQLVGKVVKEFDRLIPWSLPPADVLNEAVRKGMCMGCDVTDGTVTASARGTAPGSNDTTGQGRLRIQLDKKVVFDQPIKGTEHAQLTSLELVPSLGLTHPLVFAQFFSGGAHCCTLEVLGEVEDDGNVRVTTADSGNVAWSVKRIGANATYEFVDYDLTAYTFGHFASGIGPLVVWGYRNHHLVDVTRTHPGMIRRDAARAFQTMRGTSVKDAEESATATYLADELRLGLQNTAWKDVRAHYRGDFDEARSRVGRWLVEHKFASASDMARTGWKGFPACGSNVIVPNVSPDFAEPAVLHSGSFTTDVAVSFNDAGSVTDVRISRSSGLSAVDQAAIDAADAAEYAQKCIPTAQTFNVKYTTTLSEQPS